MKKILTLLLCVLSLQCIAQQTSTEHPRFKGLDTAFARVLKTWHAAGFAVAVVQKNKIIYAKGFGYRDIAGKLPVTPNTLFAIGSCTKAFTATLIGKLQKDGKLDIDKPVNNYLPELKFYNDAMTNSITLRDMMSHRTGLSRYDLSWYFFNTPSTDSLIQRIQYMEPTFAIRQKWQYNNFMFAAQGAVVQHLTGKSWGDNIRQNFFVPLGMTRSNVSIPEMEKTDDIAIGYGVKKDSIIKKLEYYHIDGMEPAGAINSSVNDMAKWVGTWINNGKYYGKEIIPAHFRDEAISSQSIIDGALPGKENPDVYFANYGFGWFLSSYKGHYRVEHGGNIDGFSANTCFFPADSVGIVVLSNQNGSAVPSIVRNLIADRILNLKYHDWNSDMRHAADKSKKEADKVKKEKIATAIHNPATHALADFAGSYKNPAYGTLKLTVKNDSLFAKTVGQTIWLRHSNYDIFDIFDKDPKDGIDTSENSDLKIQFHMNLAGDIDGLESLFEAGVKPVLFTKAIEAKPVTLAELQKYIGEYTLAGITAKVYVKDDKTLFLLVPGQPDYEMVPMGNDKFAMKTLSGYYLQFGPISATKITEATFIQPNGSFKAARK
ncbi:MAG TPA: serine hydrolase [Mucilaginibacter sp.]|jgi:CubicO group peptidase (beta-lactamase class C family)